MSWNPQAGGKQYQQVSNWGSPSQQNLVMGSSGQQNYGNNLNQQRLPDPTALLNLSGGSGNQKPQGGYSSKLPLDRYNYGDNNYGRDSWFKEVRKNEKIFFNPHPNKDYKIISALGNNMCLDVNMQANKIGLWTFKNSDNQKFRFKMQNNRIMIFPASCQGKCLQVSGGIMGNGINITPGLPSGGVHQKFEFVPNHNEGAKPNEFYIRTFCNKTFDLARESTVNGAQVFQYHFHGGNNQLWKVQPIQK